MFSGVFKKSGVHDVQMATVNIGDEFLKTP